MYRRLLANEVIRNLYSLRTLLALLFLLLMQWYPVYMEMSLAPVISGDHFYYLAIFSGMNTAIFYTIVAVPCAVSWPDDYHYGMTLYVPMRCSPKKYACAKTIGAWLSYFIFCFISVLLFMVSVVLVTRFRGELTGTPYIQSGIDLSRTYYYLASKSYLLYYVIRAVSTALVASMWSMISFLVSVYFGNVFLTISFPPIIVYFIINLMHKISAPWYLNPIVIDRSFFHLHSVAVTLLYTLAYCLIIAGTLGWFSYRRIVKEVLHA